MTGLVVGWVLLMVGAAAFGFAVCPPPCPPDPVDEQFHTAAREPAVVDLDRIRQIFDEITAELPDLPDLPALYEPGKEEHG